MRAEQVAHRWTVLRDLKHTQHRNCFIYHAGNSEAHEGMKFEVFKWAKKQGYLVVVEARFNDGKRADILIVDTAQIVEIETNQNRENIKKKRKAYNYRWLEDVVILDPSKKFHPKMLL